MKKNNKPFSKPVAILLLLLSVAGAIGLIFLFNSPALQPFRDSLIFTLIIRLLISGAVVYFVWFAKEKPTPAGRIITSLILLAIWLPLIVSSNRTLLFIDTVILWIFIVYMLYLFLTYNKIYTVIYLSTAWFGLAVFMSLEDYRFINNPGGIHFWQIPLILGLVAAVFFAIAFRWNSIPEIIGYSVIAFFFTFCLVWSTACNLNYAFDTSEPEEYMAVIEEMEIDSGYRRPTRYKLMLDIGGESVELNVSQSEYHSYNISDKFPVKMYQGAFDDPYYISGNM